MTGPEDHQGTDGWLTPAEIDALLGRSDVDLTLDTGHLVLGGGDPVAGLERWGSRVNHVHVKDVRRDVMTRARAEDWSFLDAVLGPGAEIGIYTVPGDGMVDYPAVFRALPDYAGWVVIEAEQDPATEAAAARAQRRRDRRRARRDCHRTLCRRRSGSV